MPYHEGVARTSRPDRVMAESLPPELLAKSDRLLEVLRGFGRVVVAFSGGIDSTVVANAAFLALGDQTVAVTADSPSVPRRELEEAGQLAKQIGIRHRIVETEEFDDPDYVRNDGTRCYFCKSELYGRVESLLPLIPFPSPLGGEGLGVRGEAVVCSGANLDDQGDYRPGLRAAAEHGVRHPLQEASFTKADVRALARAWGLPTWDKPASKCRPTASPGCSTRPCARNCSASSRSWASSS